MVEIRCLNAKSGANYVTYYGDCVDVVRQLPNNSVGLSVFSPPFSGLYLYNESICDMGNSDDDEQFFKHYSFLAGELFRVMMPGRLCVVHCKDLIYYRTQRGTAGLRDFPGDLIRAHVAAGFDFHSRVTIWRSPVREMTKTKAHGLLYKQLRADSSFSRQGLPEYLVIFRKWAKEDEEVRPVTHGFDDFSLERWQEWASPVWMDTRETDVLNADRNPNDEKHICPLPLDLIERAVTLWSNPGDVVMDPFVGIGSTGVVALKSSRKFVGVELKDTYWKQACENMDGVDRQESLFDDRYQGHDDFSKSYDACLEAVRDRVAAGGPGWEPK